MEIARSLQQWMATADAEDRRQALVRFADESSSDDAQHDLIAEGISIAEWSTSEATVIVTPGLLRGLIDEHWIASIEPPPGTGDPGDPGVALDD